MSAKHRILILGGGFGGLYTALGLEKKLHKYPNVEVTLVNRENFFLFTPMLHEVAAGDLDLTNIVNPVRKLLRKVNFFEGEVEDIDLEKRSVLVSHGFDRHTHELEFDQIVLGLGSSTNFFGLPGLEEHALTMKSLSDAINLRNRLIALLEEADTECVDSGNRKALLTFIVAGGGFAGVETMGGINDFVRDSLPFFPNIRQEDIRMVLVHPGPAVLPELSTSLGQYTQETLRRKGIDIRLNTKVEGYEHGTVMLSDGSLLATHTLIWTAGTTPHSLLAALPCTKERGRIVVNDTLEVKGSAGVWAIGDCALVPDRTTGKYCPPTAQHALREGKVLAHNLLATLSGASKKSFSFATIGQLAAIGRRCGVASILGKNFQGFIAWWLWRTIYLSKLPRLEKKVRVALDWTLDLLFSKDLVQYVTFRPAQQASRFQRNESTKAISARQSA
ncbi:MAG: NAD(P)/FAD-dependent oxidoreductase [Acidobacteria bacterium]|nr:MAG: NAD(P)/FAD-dependent oxidoreductase [Acidobacteriota bacterium]